MSSTGAEKRVGFACSFSPGTESSLNKYGANEGTHDSWTERTQAQSFVQFALVTPSRGRKCTLGREEALRREGNPVSWRCPACPLALERDSASTPLVCQAGENLLTGC